MWAPNWADLIKEQLNKKKHNTSIIFIWKLSKLILKFLKNIIWLLIDIISKSYVKLYIIIKNINKKKSLILLNVNALKAAFNVLTFVDQKFIKKKDVNPINSQPKNNIIIFPDETKNSILNIKEHKNSKNLSTKGSNLK